MKDLRFSRWWLAGGIVLVALVIYYTLAQSPIGVPFTLEDKPAHLLAYFVLMTWFAGVIVRRHHWQTAVVLAVLGAVLEGLQGVGGLRLFEWLDMVANVAGVLVAWIMTRVGTDNWCGWCERQWSRSRGDTT